MQQAINSRIFYSEHLKDADPSLKRGRAA